MKKIKTMVNGIPGKVATGIAARLLSDNRFELICASFTGPEIETALQAVGSAEIRLVRPDQREADIKTIIAEEGPFITIDFTLPAAVNENAEFYCRHRLPFVMGTTGGDRKRLEETVRSSGISAVIAPNMAKQIVGFQAMMAYAAEHFPGLFSGYTLEIKESHQKTKVDTSGTAKAMVKSFNRLGVDFSADRIIKVRDPQVQKDKWGVPEQYLDGHGWHFYTLDAPDKTARFGFSHCINGREIYAEGTLDAILFLHRRIEAEKKARLYTMIDVLSEGYTEK